MNVNDVPETLEYPKDLLGSIFAHQHALAEKYIPIERSNGLCQYDQIPGDIDNAKCQARIKDMSWRCIEEVAEAMEAFWSNDTVHFQEELADAMHFLVEKHLICGFYPANPLEWYTESAAVIDQDIEHRVARFIIASGLTCNCLKNKPWKQSQILTDKNKFFRLLEVEFDQFINLCYASGYNAKTLYDMYIRKNQVNQFRQRSNY